jgi:hypothetical protein
MALTGDPMIEALFAQQAELAARLEHIGSHADETLAAGKAVLAFAGREEVAFSAVAALLDPAAVAELSGEHDQIAEDLELLEWLLSTTPASPDVAALSSSLARRMREHVERDGRLLARASSLSTRE